MKLYITYSNGNKLNKEVIAAYSENGYIFYLPNETVFNHWHCIRLSEKIIDWRVIAE